MRPGNRFLFVFSILSLFTATTFAQNSEQKASADEGLRRIDTQSRHRSQHIDVRLDEKFLDATIETAVSAAMRSLEISLANLDIHLDPINITLPQIDINIEPIEVNIPEIDIEPIEINVPDIDIDIEPIKVTVPEIE